MFCDFYATFYSRSFSYSSSSASVRPQMPQSPLFAMFFRTLCSTFFHTHTYVRSELDFQPVGLCLCVGGNYSYSYARTLCRFSLFITKTKQKLEKKIKGTGSEAPYTLQSGKTIRTGSKTQTEQNERNNRNNNNTLLWRQRGWTGERATSKCQILLWHGEKKQSDGGGERGRKGEGRAPNSKQWRRKSSNWWFFSGRNRIVVK